MVARNFAKALGRFALLDPNSIAPQLDLFGKKWCLAI